MTLKIQMVLTDESGRSVTKTYLMSGSWAEERGPETTLTEQDIDEGQLRRQAMVKTIELYRDYAHSRGAAVPVRSCRGAV